MPDHDAEEVGSEDEYAEDFCEEDGQEGHMRPSSPQSSAGHSPPSSPTRHVEFGDMPADEDEHGTEAEGENEETLEEQEETEQEQYEEQYEEPDEQEEHELELELEQEDRKVRIEEGREEAIPERSNKGLDRSKTRQPTGYVKLRDLPEDEEEEDEEAEENRDMQEDRKVRIEEGGEEAIPERSNKGLDRSKTRQPTGYVKLRSLTEYEEEEDEEAEENRDMQEDRKVI
ncbi:unnamed protein product [Polarella glacialis]|uniref:Uncharacterized protein n=1 Tax=Polarella glacialis TaxID=89957 RepID=A0A813LN72_POLGL|nr:unnamed protein product [Polarella glacialis]